jgi:hypothetical protein
MMAEIGPYRIIPPRPPLIEVESVPVDITKISPTGKEEVFHSIGCLDKGF